jgi:hypothetical protein
MRRRLAAWWEFFWLRPTGPLPLVASRTVVCASALWIVLSRPGLPDVFAWPHAFWLSVDRGLATRFLIFGIPLAAERALYVLLTVALAACLFGVLPRASAFAAALLLYHFAPLEDIFASRGGPFFRGLTVPVLSLFLFAFAPAPRRPAEPSSEHRWPVAGAQFLLACTYLLSGLSKILTVGPPWISGRNFEGLVVGLMLPEVVPPWAHLFVGRPVLCQLGALAGFAMDFGVPVAAFSPKAARWIVPAAVLAHLAVIPIFGVFFLALPQLLLFVDWEERFSALRRLRARQ